MNKAVILQGVSTAFFMKKNILQRSSAILLLLVAVALLYGRFLRNPIVFDDIYFFVLDGAGEQPVSKYHFAWLQLRSLPYATLAWTKIWFGLDLIYFRIINLILHLAVCCAMYFFLNLLLDSVHPANQEFSKTESRTSSQSMALVTALLFAVHPMATYAAGYLVQRTILFSTLFCLLTMWVWVWCTIRSRFDNLWIAVPLYYLAVFSKEHAVMLVAVLPLLTVLLHADWKRLLWRQMGVQLALISIAVFALLARKGIVGSVYEVRADEMLRQGSPEHHYILSIATQMALFFKYVYLWLTPNPRWMSIDMREPFATEISPFYVCTTVAFIAWGSLGFRLLFKRDNNALLGFAMLFPWLMFMTELSTVRIQEVFVIYRSYLWAAGAICAIPLVLQRFRIRNVVVFGASCVLVLFMLSMDCLVTMSHPILLWENAKMVLAGRDDLPGASRIYYNLGIQYFRAGSFEKAIPEFRQSITLSPNFAEAYGYLGVAYLKNGEWLEAVDTFDKAMAVESIDGSGHAAKYLLSRAQAFEMGGNNKKAQADYQESCRVLQIGCEKVR